MKNLKNKVWTTLSTELAHVKTDVKSLRSFAWIVGGIFLALGVLFSRKHGWTLNWMSGLGVLLIVAGMMRPSSLRVVYLFWMGLGLVMGMVVAPVMFALLYFSTITPISLLMRIIGKKFLNTQFRDESNTYWLAKPKKENPQKNAENQF